MTQPANPLTNLTNINLDDLVDSFGWQRSPRLAAAMRGLFHAPAQKFARQMLGFDALVSQQGLPVAARQTLPTYASSLHVFGRENIPASGPALFLSNHPGMADTLALFCGIRRNDLHIIATRRPFLQALVNTAQQHLFFISEDPAGRMQAVKQTAAHLKNGGAVLTFPAGKIEPDADIYPGALEALDGWTDSAGLFLRFAPETRIIPTFVRGVLWNKAVRHPLTYLVQKDEFERQKLGAAFQLIGYILFNLNRPTIRIQFGEPITLAQVGSSGAAAIHAAVLAGMRQLVQNPPSGQQGERIL